MSKHTDLQSLKEYTPEDRFNYLHRHEAGLDRHYATDVDLVLVEKHPEPHIPAFFEFKQEGEPVRFTQALLFAQLQSFAPVFIIEATTDVIDTPPDEHRFTVKRFDSVQDIKKEPPEIELETLREDIPWGGCVTYSSPFEREHDGGSGLIGFEETLRNRHFDHSDAKSTADSSETNAQDANVPTPRAVSLQYFMSEVAGDA